ncbi:MAG: DUF58 domain-containing protein [Burkholderiales bacterium]
MQVSPAVNERVQISVASLVRLNQAGSNLPLDARRVQARQSGDYQSPFKGRGMEFDESRPYQPGDDIRNIDWRVTARTGRTHTKLFREERERPVFLWVDLRAPMFFATRGRYKSVLAAHMASLLGWSAVYHGDRVGAVIFSDDMHYELKPQRGKAAVLRLIKQMVRIPAWDGQFKPQSGAEAGVRALLRLHRVARPGSLIFLLSDFRRLDDHIETELLRLSRHSDLVLVFIHDRLETELPPAGIYRVSDGAQEWLLDTWDRSRTEEYQRRFRDHVERLERLARRRGIYLIQCGTSDDPFAALQTGLVTGRP